MKELVILGAGTAGTIMANRLRRRLNPAQWRIRIVDEHPTHYYQPGFLFLPFGIYQPKDVMRPRQRLFAPGVEYIEARAERIEPDRNRLHLADGRSLPYDALVIATGTQPVPAQVEGMLGDDWGRRTLEFYTLAGARGLAEQLHQWRGDRLVVPVSEMPIKCPVAPLEFAFLADWWLQMPGLPHRTEGLVVTQLPGAFTKAVAAGLMIEMLDS